MARGTWKIQVHVITISQCRMYSYPVAFLVVVVVALCDRICGSSIPRWLRFVNPLISNVEARFPSNFSLYPLSDVTRRCLYSVRRSFNRFVEIVYKGLPWNFEFIRYSHKLALMTCDVLDKKNNNKKKNQEKYENVSNVHDLFLSFAFFSLFVNIKNRTTVTAVSWHPYGNFLASVDRTKTVTIWGDYVW